MRYAGIGSCETPRSIGQTCADIAYYLATHAKMILVSGGARGADSFFEEGCDVAMGKKEIWMPHEGFNKRASKLYPSKEAFVAAERFVPHWKSCGEFARSAHARNCHQVLGADLRTPVCFIACWTPGGEHVGGTATALNIAQEFAVPVLNLGLPHSFETISEFLDKNMCNTQRCL